MSPADCFDALFIPKDHVSRKPTDTFYKSDTEMLRTHTSVHQIPLLNAGNRNFLCIGDVYRKDTVDKTHYPAFHQCEGVRIFSLEELGTKCVKEAKIIVERDLQ